MIFPAKPPCFCGIFSSQACLITRGDMLSLCLAVTIWGTPNLISTWETPEESQTKHRCLELLQSSSITTSSPCVRACCFASRGGNSACFPRYKIYIDIRTCNLTYYRLYGQSPFCIGTSLAMFHSYVKLPEEI